MADRAHGVAPPESARVSILIILTYLVGLGAFNHIVAGSSTVFFLVVSPSLTWGEYFLRFFLPTLLGNIVGGVTLVAALAHAQVVGGRDMPGEGRASQGGAGRTLRQKARLYVS
jgi:hypothetical protein